MVLSGDAESVESQVGRVAFGDFYRLELDAQVRRAVLLLGSNDIANDVVHDAFIAVYRRWDTLDEPGPYLHMTVLNGCRGIHRQRSRQRRLLPRVVDRDAAASVDEHLDDVLAELPFNRARRGRAALLLRVHHRRDRFRAGLRGRLGRPVDQPSARENAEGPAMTDLEQQLTDHLRRRAAAATPRYDLDGIEQGTDIVSLVDLDDHRSRRRSRSALLVAAAAVAAAVVAIAVVTIPSDDPRVSTPSDQSTVPTSAPARGDSAAFDAAIAGLRHA